MRAARVRKRSRDLSFPQRNRQEQERPTESGVDIKQSDAEKKKTKRTNKQKRNTEEEPERRTGGKTAERGIFNQRQKQNQRKMRQRSTHRQIRPNSMI